MKSIIFLIIIALLIILPLRSKGQVKSNSTWTVFNAYERIISVGKIAKPGKTSVFIVSTHWCPPCKTLKRDLQQAMKNGLNNVDFYEIQMATDHNGVNHSFADLRTTEAYRFWRQLELLKEWPLIYIASPATNVVKKFSPSDLTSGSAFEKIVEVIHKLQMPSEGFSEAYLIQSTPPVSPQNAIALDSIRTQIDQDQFSDPNLTNPNIYRVRLGDTMHDIAKKLEISYKKLQRLNGHIDPNKIFPGQELIISRD